MYIAGGGQACEAGLLGLVDEAGDDIFLDNNY